MIKWKACYKNCNNWIIWKQQLIDYLWNESTIPDAINTRSHVSNISGLTLPELPMVHTETTTHNITSTIQDNGNLNPPCIELISKTGNLKDDYRSDNNDSLVWTREPSHD